MKKAIVFAGSDGHGVAMGVVSAHNLEAAGFQVTLDCRWPETGRPRQFWGQTFLSTATDELELVVVVDIPIPEADGTFPNAVRDALRVIEEMTRKGVAVVVIDHHKASESHYGAARAAGAEVIVTSTAATCCWGDISSPFAARWARLGAVCDLDEAVLPCTAEEIAAAAGIDRAVREDLPGAIEAMKRDDLAYFMAKAALPEIPGEVSVSGDVLLATETTPTWGFKQLSRAAAAASTPYAVGVDCFQGMWRVIAITVWTAAGALPVALKLGLTRFIGHAQAILVPVCPAEDPQGREKAWARAKAFVAVLNSDTASAGEDRGNGLGEFFAQVSRFLREARIPRFLTQHGWPHVERVVAHARTLGSLLGLSAAEQKLLDWAALFHDLGNGAAGHWPERGLSDAEARRDHHLYSKEMVQDWAKEGRFDGLLEPEEVLAVAEMVSRHRKATDLPSEPRLRMLTVILRVADAMDIDQRRAQRNDDGEFFEDISSEMDPGSIPHWKGHRAIQALRVVANGGLTFEVIVSNRKEAAFQVAEISKELAVFTEVCNWTLRVIGPNAE